MNRREKARDRFVNKRSVKFCVAYTHTHTHTYNPNIGRRY